MPVDYQLGKIYKMESPSGLVYIGSTCEPTLARRLAGHKRNYKKWKNGKFNYVTSFKLFEENEENVQIYLINKYPCDNKDELRAEEGKTIKEYNCVNKFIAGRTRKQWFEDNKNKIKETQKNYRINNKEKIKLHNNEKHDCICGGRFTTASKLCHFKSEKHTKYIESQQ